MSAKTKKASAAAKSASPATAAAPAVVIELKAGDKVSFAAPLGMVNTGVIEKIEDGVAAVEVDKPIVTFPLDHLTKV